MSAKPLKVALLQETDRGSVSANLDAIEAGLRKSAAAGVQLVLLQELHHIHLLKHLKQYLFCR